MSHNCGTSCKRKTGGRCATCRRPGSLPPGVVHVEPPARKPHGTPQQIGAAVDMYYDGLSYRRVAENVGDYFNRPTAVGTVFSWVKDMTGQAKEVVDDITVNTGPEWVADEIQVKLNGQKYWIFNVMDSKTRFVLAAYLSKERGSKAAATAMALARERSVNPPERIKTDGLRSYVQGIKTAFPTHPVKHVVSKGIRDELNNNLSERLQGTFRDRDKTLRGLKQQESGQTYIDGLVLNYNFFRPHIGLKGKRPAESAGAEIPFTSWVEVATMVEDHADTPQD